MIPLNPARIRIVASHFGLMHLITDLPVSLTEQEAHQEQKIHGDLISFSFMSQVHDIQQAPNAEQTNERTTQNGEAGWSQIICTESH